MKILFFQFMLILITSAMCNSAIAQFGQQIELTESTRGAEDVKTYDIDGDGDLDVLSASSNDDKIAWHENVNGVIYGTQHIISIDADGATSVDAADFDGDGDLDVVSGSYDDDKIAWYENLGNGVFGTEKIISLNNTLLTACIFAVDIDNDGDIDVISGSIQDGKVAWYENNGLGNFGPQQVITQSAGSIFDVFSTDFDNDGDMDIFSTGTSQTSFIENLGGGVFGSIIQVGTSSSAYSVSCADIDNDGDLDVLTASDSDEIAWYANSGGGVFGAKQLISTSIDYGRSVFAADLDNDGNQDVLSASIFDDKIAWYKNLGGGIFGPQQIINSNDVGAIAVCAADLNNDGFIDVVSASKYASNVIWYPNQGAGVFNVKNIISINSGSSSSLISFDIDEDGDQDIISADPNYNDTGQVYLYENLGGTFATQQALVQYNGNSISRVHLVDFDNDGDQDLLTLSTPNVADITINWFENLGAGVFGPAQLIYTDPFQGKAISTADINIDGDMDIIYSSYNNGALVWFENQGGGIFGTPQFISATPDALDNVLMVDVNSDGYSDIVCNSSIGDKIVWFQNLGNGTFGSELVISSTVDNPGKVSAVDIDNDGDFDLFCGVYWDDKVIWFENLGGTFGSEQVIDNSQIRAKLVVPADIDGDGDFDIFCSTNTSLVWYENQGGASFGNANLIRHINNVSLDLIVSDLDNDGSIEPIYTVGSKVATHLSYFLGSYQLQGSVYYDENQNGEIDTTDYGLSFINTELLPTSQVSFTSLEGNYFHAIDTGTYAVNYPTIPHWDLTSDSVNYTRTVTGVNPIEDSLDFGFYPDSIFTSILPDLTAGFPRCNRIINFWANINNFGTNITNGIVHLNLADSITFVSSTFPPDSIIGQNMYWTFDSLFYFDHKTFRLSVQMPNFTTSGDTMSSILTVYELDSVNNVTYTNADTLNQVLLCAYDPNDKTVTPEGLGSEGFIKVDQELEYLIRFQNTGNDTAFVVVVRDLLDVDLDWASFEIVSSSHNMEAWIESNGEAVFRFPDIMLPDSNVNELGSQGFVKFKIKPKLTLATNTQILNTGHIYFDYNPAIITNSVLNTIYDCETAPINLSSSVICYGEQLEAYSANEDFDSYTWEIDAFLTETADSLIWIADSVGTFNLNMTLSNVLCTTDSLTSFTVLPPITDTYLNESICPGDSVLLNGVFQSIADTYTDTLQSTSGCDSIVSITLQVNPVFTSNQDLSICQGDSILVFGNYVNSVGIYVDTLQSISSCDSIITKTIVVNAILSSSQNLSICQGDSILMYGNYVNSVGMYYDTIQSSLGCDSTISTMLDVNPIVSSNQNQTICQGDSILVFGNYENAAGIYLDTVQSFLGCDSIISMDLIVNTIDVNTTSTDTSGIANIIGASYQWLDCNNNFDIIIGETSQSYFASSNGEFAVEISQFGCVDTSNCIVISTIGIAENPLFDGVFIFPNPSKGIININFGLLTNIDLKIYTSLGEIIYQKDNIVTANYQMELNEASGVYFLELCSEGECNKYKLVKNTK